MVVQHKDLDEKRLVSNVPMSSIIFKLFSLQEMCAFDILTV